MLDVAGALAVLPDLPLGDEDQAERQRATGTTDDAARTLVPMLVPRPGKRGISESTADKAADHKAKGSPFASDCNDKPCEPLAIPAKKRAMGLEPTTFSLEG